jgi:tetratricopeptide (TPR) repeat protein
LVCLLLSTFASAQNAQNPAFAPPKSRVQLESSETLFSVLTAMNACNYDDGMKSSDPVRQQVRNEVQAAIERSPEAALSQKYLCDFYQDHKPSDSNRDLSQYVSLALNLGPPPDFKPTVREADLPPDAEYVLGFAPEVARFYKAADLHKIWLQVQPHYQELLAKFNPPLANMILATDVYLKNPISGSVAHDFIIYVEPMAGPGQVNARNYGANYYLVASPDNGQLPMDQIRHTYLHFELDRMAMGRPIAMKRLSPLLTKVLGAPLQPAFKTDISLLVTESLIRAIEARLLPGGKAADPQREDMVNKDMARGFILTRYFYDSLIKFETEPTSMRTAFPDFLYYMDVGKEMKRASQIEFSKNGDVEVVKGKIVEQQDPLDEAQQKIVQHDLEGAQRIAEEVAAKKDADAPRADFILGEVATLNKDKDGAISHFEQALRTSKDPKIIAWSHIYLGRIYDVDQERELAVKHYQAALTAGDDTPQLKAAAQKGLEAGYERPQQPEEKEQ